MKIIVPAVMVMTDPDLRNTYPINHRDLRNRRRNQLLTFLHRRINHRCRLLFAGDGGSDRLGILEGGRCISIGQRGKSQWKKILLFLKTG